MKMTGAFVRINRDGEAVNLDIAELTDAELETFFKTCDVDSSRNWALCLAAWIRENVLFELVFEERQKK